MCKSIAAFFSIIILLLIGPQITHAQTSIIQGSVTKIGDPVNGVNIIVINQSTDLRRGAYTKNEGRYLIEKLPAGSYLLRATAIGYKANEQYFKLGEDDNIELNLEMAISEQQLNQIIVQNRRFTEVTSNTVQSINEIELEQQDATSFADVARSFPAAHVATNSRGQTILYFRDSADRQTAQFFNGALLNVPWDNRVDISVLPAAMLSSVTVSKGIPSIAYGTNTIGGAVNFKTTTSGKTRRQTSINLSGGSPERGQASIIQKGRSGNFSYTAEIGLSARGDFALPKNADLPYSQPSSDTRVNTDRRLFNTFLEGAYQFDSGFQLSTSLLHVDAEKGVAPESNLNPDVTGVRYWRYPKQHHTMITINGRIPLNNGASLNGAIWGSRFSQDIHQYQSVDYDQLDETQADLDYTAGLRFIYKQPLGPGMLDIALNALTTRHDQTIVPYSNNTATPDSNSTYNQQIYSIGGMYELPLTDKLESMVSLSYESSAITNTGPWEDEGYESYIKNAIGISAGLTYSASDQLLLHVNAGRRPRFPTMRELYGGALGKFVPNPDLKPVTVYKGELGAKWQTNNFSSQLTAFFSRTYDTVDKTTIQEGPNAGKEQRINLDGTRVWGIETALGGVQLSEQLSLKAHFTWMQLRGFFEGEPRKLDEKPSFLGLLTANYTILDGFKAMAQAEYLGGVYSRTEQNTFVTLPDALIFDARIAYELSGRWLNGGEIFLRVNNVTDELRLLQLGLPGPGREYMGGLKFSF